MKDFFKILIIVVVVLTFSLLYAKSETKKQQNRKKEETVKPIIKSNSDMVKLKVDGKLNVYYFDVGQADAIVIENNGYYMLIDAGNNADGKNLVAYFKRMGIKKFDRVIATHAHEDHIGGMDDILNNFEVSHFYMPDVVTTTKTFEDVITALEDKKIELEIPKEGDVFILGTCKFEVLHVGTEDDDLNDSSIVVRGLFGDNSFLFTGDATGNVEEDLLDKNIDSDVLKVGHHGSKYSSTKEFLDTVTPEYAIISVGEGNSYQHPHDVSLNRIKASGAKIYRTDREGTIIATSDGKDVTFRTIETELDG